MAATLKKRAWYWCAKYIKLRDAIEDLPITNDIDLVRCRTCGRWLKTKSKNSQACHYISRGLGGGSGVYFDERNIHIGCYQCNCFKQGSPVEYNDFMLKKYGQSVIDELKMKDKFPQKQAYWALIEFYKEKFQELKSELLQGE